MKNRKLLIIVSIVILIFLIIGVVFLIFDTNPKKELKTQEVVRLNYTVANYNVMVAKELDNYINNNYDFKTLENNKSYQIPTSKVLANLSEEYQSCDGNIEFIKISDEQYTFTIKSDCDNEYDKQVIIKGYSNPFNEEDFYRVNALNKISNGYLALVDKPDLDIDDDGYAMYLVSFDMVIKYDEDMNEISRHNIHIQNQNIMNVLEMEDGNYSVFSEDADSSYYVSIMDENFNLLSTISTGYENLSYLELKNDNYYYSYWDKVYELDKKDFQFNVIKTLTGDEYSRSIRKENNLIYSTYYDLLESGYEIYNNELESIKSQKFTNINAYEILVNEKIALVVEGDNPENYLLTFYDVNTSKELRQLTIQDVITNLINDGKLTKDYNGISDVTFKMQAGHLFMVIKAQYFKNEEDIVDEEIYDTDNILVNITNDLNIELVNLYKANYIKEILKTLDADYDTKISADNSYIDINKYIDFVTTRLDKDMLLYVIYE